MWGSNGLKDYSIFHKVQLKVGLPIYGQVYAQELIEISVKSKRKSKQNPKLSNSLNRSLRSTHTQDLLPTTQHHHTHEPTHAHPQEEE